MRVACSRCKTAQDIPPEKLTDEVLKVRCTQCGHVFGVRKKKEEPATGKEVSSAPGTAVPSPPPGPAAAPAAAPQPPVRPPLPDDNFEEEQHDIHWLDEIDIPKIEDVIQAVQNKMAAAAAASSLAAAPSKPKEVPVPPSPAAPARPGAAPIPPPPPAPGMPRTEAVQPPPSPQPAVAKPPEAATRPTARPAKALHAPSRPETPTQGARRPGQAARPAPGPAAETARGNAPRRASVPPAPDLPPQEISAPARRRVSAAGIVFLLALLLFAGTAGFVAATRPEAFALLSSRLADPMGSAEAEFILDEPVIGAQLSRPDKRPLFVIMGWIRGAKGALPSSVRVEGRLYGVGGVELASGEALCGTLLTEEDLVTLADSEIVSRLQRAPSAGGAARVPFMIVIPDPPRGVEKHAERIVPAGAGG